MLHPVPKVSAEVKEGTAMLLRITEAERHYKFILREKSLHSLVVWASVQKPAEGREINCLSLYYILCGHTSEDVEQFYLDILITS